MSKEEIQKVLNIDKKSREPGASEPDLWTLKQVNFNKDWNYSLPTIYSEDKVSLRNTMVKDNNHFNTLFKRNYSRYLSKVNFDNILVAGGCVTSTLLQTNWDNDVDIFIYGLNEAEANKKVATLIEQMYESYQDALLSDYMKQRSEKGLSNKPLTEEQVSIVWAERAEIMNIRNKHCITMTFDYDQKIQIILRLYKSMSEILHGFDLGSSAIGYDGKEVYFTSLGRFSYEYLANIIDTSRRSTTYEVRLKKYYDRGFQIILPNLDMSKLRTEYLRYNLVEVCRLPYFVFSYWDIKGNKIQMDELLEWGINASKPDEEKPDSDYQPGDIDEYKIFYLNLRNLVKDGTDYYYFSSRMNFDILEDPPYITSSRIIDFYDRLGECIYDKSGFNGKIFSAYFSDELLPQVLNQLFIKKNHKYLNEMIQKQKALILERFEKMTKMDHTKLSWITKNPGTQLTSSFNPIIADPKDWYGHYYLPNVYVEKNHPPSTSKPKVQKRKNA